MEIEKTELQRNRADLQVADNGRGGKVHAPETADYTMATNQKPLIHADGR